MEIAASASEGLIYVAEARDPDAFIVMVDDSLMPPVLQAGDAVVVSPARKGDPWLRIAAIRTRDGEIILRYLTYEDDRAVIRSEGQSLPALTVPSVEAEELGRVVGLVRKIKA